MYSPSGNFCVDVFTTSTFHDLSTNLNIKIKKYSNFKEKLYFVLISDNLSRKDLELLTRRKKIKLSDKMSVVMINDFIDLLKNMSCYENPVGEND